MECHPVVLELPISDVNKIEIASRKQLWSHVWMLSCFSLVQLFVTLWTIACQAPLSTGFSRQQYWSGLPLSPPEDLSDLGMEPMSLALAGGWASEESEVAQSCLTLCNPMNCSLPRFSIHGIFPGNNTGVGCHFLLQGIFLTQGLNPGLLHCRQMLYCLSHQGKCHRNLKLLQDSSHLTIPKRTISYSLYIYLVKPQLGSLWNCEKMKMEQTASN